MLDMIPGRGMTVDRHRKVKRKKQLRNPMTAIRHNGKMALECFIEDILEMGLFPVNPVSALQSLLNPVYYLAMARETRQRRAIRHVIEEAGRPLSPHEVLKVAQVYPAPGDCDRLSHPQRPCGRRLARAGGAPR